MTGGSAAASHPHTTPESKTLAPSEDRKAQSQLDTIKRDMPDSIRRRRVQGNLNRLRNKLVSALKAISQKVINEKMPARDAADQARIVLTSVINAAAKQGLVIAGVPDWQFTNDQIDALAMLVETEVDYFFKFMAQLASEAMNPDDRLDLYGGSVGSGFWRGWVAALPSNAQIDWMLSIAEHCDDCLELSYNSPYTKPGIGSNPLTTTPRNGDTQCLGNCKCFLESTVGLTSGLINKPGVEVISMGRHEVDPMSPAARGAAQLYLELAQRYVFYRRMDLVDPAGGYGALADDVFANLQDMANRLGHGVRLTMTMAEITQPVMLARALGYKFVRPQDLSDDLVLLVATILAIDEVDRGKITAVQKSPPVVTLDGDHDRRYRLDANGRAMLFVPE